MTELIKRLPQGRRNPKATLISKFFYLMILGNFVILWGAEKELRWDWRTIDVSSATFPANFQFCAATSEYQISGNSCFNSICPDSNWSRYEKLAPIEPVGRGVDHWDRYKEDVALIKQLGVTVYRCSIDWARVQPREGVYDLAVIQHYHELFDELRAHQIKPMVTLHHFVNPGWFEDKGAFEQEENIAYFVAFAQRMFAEFGAKVPYWVTINEPGVYAAQTYVTHAFPRPMSSNLGFPCNLGLGMCLYGAAMVVKHLMMAHVKTYEALKQMPGGQAAQIGIVHNVIHFEPYHPNNWLEQAMSSFLRSIYSDNITKFLLTGNLGFKTYTGTVTWQYPAIKSVQDYIGLNYYSHVLVSWHHLKPALRPEDGEIKTDMGYGCYPEGLYRALIELAPLGKPIYITENGLADTRDEVRDLWYKRYLYAVSLAIKQGVDVRMFCAWSLFDNFEWNLGYDKKFGLYAIDRTTFKRTLKAGAEYLRKVAHRQADYYRKARKTQRF